MSSCFCGSMSKNEHLPTCYLVFKINREKRGFLGPTWHKAKQPRQGKELQKNRRKQMRKAYKKDNWKQAKDRWCLSTLDSIIGKIIYLMDVDDLYLKKWHLLWSLFICIFMCDLQSRPVFVFECKSITCYTHTITVRLYSQMC